MMLTLILTDRRERDRFIRFAIVGAIGAVVDFGTYILLHDLVGVPAVPASVCSFLAAVASNFTWNRFWTYPDSRSKPVPKQILEFSIVSVIGLGIRTPLFALLEGPFSRGFNNLPAFPVIPNEFLGDKAALALTVVVVMFWNYFINRYWTFGDVD